MSVAYQRVQAHLERLKLKRVADLLEVRPKSSGAWSAKGDDRW